MQRWQQPINQFILWLLAILVVDLPAPAWLFWFAAATGAGVEYVANRLAKKPTSAQALASGISTAVSTSFMLGATMYWPLLVAIAVGILQKHVLRRTAVGHILNPSNFAIVFGLLIFQSKTESLLPLWGHHLTAQWVILALGTFTLASRRLLHVLVIFGLGYLLFAYLFYASSPFVLWSQISATGFMLYAFFFVTDPGTIPKSRVYRAIYALLSALLVVILPRFLGDQGFIPFLALLIAEWTVSIWTFLFRFQRAPHALAGAFAAACVVVWFSPANLMRPSNTVTKISAQQSVPSLFEPVERPQLAASVDWPSDDRYLTTWDEPTVKRFPQRQQAAGTPGFAPRKNAITAYDTALPIERIGSDSLPYAALAVADINRDGLQDILVAALGYPLKVFINEGKHRFADATALVFGETIPMHVENVYLADFNNDGFLDLLTMHSRYFGETSDQVRLFDPELKRFGEPVYTFGQGQYSSGGAAIADLNRDGRLDFYASYARNWIALEGLPDTFYSKHEFHVSDGNLWRNAIAEYFPKAVYGTTLPGMTAFLGDFTGDGVVDFLLGNDFAWPSYTYRGVETAEGLRFETIRVSANAYESMSYFPVDIDADGQFELWENCISYPRSLQHPQTKLEIPAYADTALADMISLVQMFKTNRFKCETLVTPVRRDLCRDLELSTVSVLKNDPAGCESIRSTQISAECKLRLHHRRERHNIDVADYVENLSSYPIQIRKNVLLKAQPNGAYEDVIDGGRDPGAYSGWTWVGIPYDVDLDGDIDIYVTNSALFMAVDQNQLLINETTPGKIKLVDRAQEFGVASWKDGRGAIFADFDNDGDGDLVINNFMDGLEYYENVGGGSSVTIHLRSKVGDYFGLGSKLTLTDPTGRKQTQLLYIGGHWNSAPPLLATFGLPDSRTANLTILWPDGFESNVDVEAGYEYVIYR